MSFVTRKNGSKGAGGAHTQQVRRDVELEAGAPSEVRELVRELVEGTPVCEDALLLASEITTNAIIHGRWTPGDVMTVSVVRRHRRVEVAVVGPGLPKPVRSRSEDTLGGFGLGLVDSISNEWAMEVFDDDLTRVWFELTW
jgi:anti-sigma regulatory factor (Ser/Thr protein kinase)